MALASLNSGLSRMAMRVVGNECQYALITSAARAEINGAQGQDGSKKVEGVGGAVEEEDIPVEGQRGLQQ